MTPSEPAGVFLSVADPVFLSHADHHARNLCVGCLIDAVRSGQKAIDIDTVNRVLTQPHWQTSVEYKDY